MVVVEAATMTLEMTILEMEKEDQVKIITKKKTSPRTRRPAENTRKEAAEEMTTTQMITDQGGHIATPTMQASPWDAYAD